MDHINKYNVDRLEVAWIHRTGDLGDYQPRSGIESNSIIVDDILYAASAHLKIFAVDAATGEELWSFDPFKGGRVVDKFAESSHLFINIHTPSPACAPARVAIMTGVHSSHSGLMRNVGGDGPVWRNRQVLLEIIPDLTWSEDDPVGYTVRNESVRKINFVPLSEFSFDDN